MNIFYKTVSKNAMETIFHSYMLLLSMKFSGARDARYFDDRNTGFTNPHPRILDIYGEHSWEEVSIEGHGTAMYFICKVMLKMRDNTRIECQKYAYRLSRTPSNKPRCEGRHAMDLLSSLKRYEDSPVFKSVIEDTFGML
jgi:hypothetical protein